MCHTFSLAHFHSLSLRTIIRVRQSRIGARAHKGWLAHQVTYRAMIVLRKAPCHLAKAYCRALFPKWCVTLITEDTSRSLSAASITSSPEDKRRLFFSFLLSAQTVGGIPSPSPAKLFPEVGLRETKISAGLAWCLTRNKVLMPLLVGLYGKLPDLPPQQ